MKPWYLRIFLWFFSKVFYQIKAISADRVPAQGGALLVSNHISFVDLLLIQASTQRFVRFLLPQQLCSLWWLRAALRCLRVIPLPEEKRSGEQAGALRQATAAIRSGEVVGLFAEK